MFKQNGSLTQTSFENYLLNKYGSVSGYESTHHYETLQVIDSLGNTIVPAGLTVPSDYSVDFYDRGTGRISLQILLKRLLTTHTSRRYRIRREIFSYLRMIM